MLEYTVPRAAVGTRGDLLVGELPASPDIAWKRDFEGREGCLGLTGDARQRLEHGSGATEPIVPGYMRFIPANGPGASLGRFADMAETSLAVKRRGEGGSKGCKAMQEQGQISAGAIFQGYNQLYPCSRALSSRHQPHSNYLYAEPAALDRLSIDPSRDDELS